MLHARFLTGMASYDAARHNCQACVCRVSDVRFEPSFLELNGFL